MVSTILTRHSTFLEMLLHDSRHILNRFGMSKTIDRHLRDHISDVERYLNELEKLYNNHSNHPYMVIEIQPSPSTSLPPPLPPRRRPTTLSLPPSPSCTSLPAPPHPRTSRRSSRLAARQRAQASFEELIRGTDPSDPDIVITRL